MPPPPRSVPRNRRREGRRGVADFLCGASLILVHVADGWVARNWKQLDLRVSEEMAHDQAYLEEVADRLSGAGLEVDPDPTERSSGKGHRHDYVQLHAVTFAFEMIEPGGSHPTAGLVWENILN